MQQTLAYYIQNPGTEGLRFLEMFKASRHEHLSLSE
jgi:oxalate decarboxylase/phosphoglucose isomerase-like protein (cupin superfamily)